MNQSVIILATITVIGAATPLLFVALGELVVERAGVLNLGLEGLMLTGAVVGFATAVVSHNSVWAFLAGMAAAAALAFVFGLLVLFLLANQVAAGLALTLFGLGFSALIGRNFVGLSVSRLPRLDIAGLSDLPILGPLLFSHDASVYLSLGLCAGVSFLLARSRLGLIIRAVGENAAAAQALGYPVRRTRLAAIVFGGACAGLGGCTLSLVYSPLWIEGMTAGRGWIALALVVFASWKPGRLLLGAYLFGSVTIMQLYAQGGGVFSFMPSEVFSMLPYLATIAVLVFVSTRGHQKAPANLGQPFWPGR